jgi:hypothetical protein
VAIETSFRVFRRLDGIKPVPQDPLSNYAIGGHGASVAPWRSSVVNCPLENKGLSGECCVEDSIPPLDRPHLDRWHWSEPHTGLVPFRALAEDRPRDAISELRRSDRGGCRVCVLPYLGRAYDLAGEPDSAIAIYERCCETPDLYRLYANSRTPMSSPSRFRDNSLLGEVRLDERLNHELAQAADH